jgi:hypothetical protein
MKPISRYLLALVFAASPWMASAQTTYTWDANGSTAYGTYDWNNYLNWNQPSGYPNATGDVANVTDNPQGGEPRYVIINLNQPITVGSLSLEDTGASRVR